MGYPVKRTDSRELQKILDELDITTRELGAAISINPATLQKYIREDSMPVSALWAARAYYGLRRRPKSDGDGHAPANTTALVRMPASEWDTFQRLLKALGGKATEIEP